MVCMLDMWHCVKYKRDAEVVFVRISLGLMVSGHQLGEKGCDGGEHLKSGLDTRTRKY